MNENVVFLPKLVTDRWAEALAKNDIATWRSFLDLCDVYICSYVGDARSVEVPALQGIIQAASKQYMGLMPKRVAA